MKKVISLLIACILTVSMLSCLTLTSFAVDPVIFLGKEVTSGKHRCELEETTEDGISCAKVTPTDEAAIPKLDKYNLKIDAVNLKYAKVIFKSNTGYPMVLDVLRDPAKSYTIQNTEANTWSGVVIQLKEAEEGQKIIQYHFSILGKVAAAALKDLNVVTYVHSIGFFATKEEAEAYEKDICKATQYIPLGGGTPAPDVSVDLEDNRDDVETSVEAPNGEPIIIKGSDLVDSKSYYDPEKNIKYPPDATDDGSIELEFLKESSIGKLQFSATGVLGFIIDKGIYKYVKVGYKYHLTNPDGNYKMMLREGFNGTSTNHKLFDLPKGKNDTLNEQYTAMTWGTSTEPNVFTLHPIREGDKAAAGDFFNVYYIAFFSTEEDAKAYTIGESSGGEEAQEDVVAHKSYMQGYNDGTFKPNKTMSRAEACTIIARLLTDENTITGLSTSFTDVPESEWYFKYVAFCESKGILKSYSGEFKPMQEITRAEFAELVFLTDLAKAGENKITFSDVPTTHPKYESISAASSAGLINGYEDGTFLPDRTITRAQVVTVINRALDRNLKSMSIPENAELTVTFTDVDNTFWAYAQIVEASNDHEVYTGAFADGLTYEIWKANVKTGDAALAKVAEVDKLAEARKQAIIGSKDELEIKGTKYYISSVSGNDTNDGKTPETAIKTITRMSGLPLVDGDAVLFKRGEIFRGHFAARDGVSYGAYGEGEKPKLYGSTENAAEVGSWKLTETKNVYVYSEKKYLDVGLIVFNNGEEHSTKYFSSKVEERTVDKLTKNFMFLHGTDSFIYLYCDKGNPGEIFDSIEMADCLNIVALSGVTGATFDNLCLMYTGAHAIGGVAYNTTVQNCVIEWIGGSQQGTSKGRYGNGVEYWGGSVNVAVKNCYVNQVYDAGITFQFKGESSTPAGFNGVDFSGNLIERCSYNIEYFARKYNGNDDVIANVKISDNILRMAGEGFGVEAPDAGGREAAIKGWDTKNQATNFVIENNIFDRSISQLLHIGSYKWDVEKQQLTTPTPQYLPVMKNNVYIQNENSLLVKWNGTGVMSNETVHRNLALKGCENTSQIFLLK